MNWDDFTNWSQTVANWGAEYHKSIRDFPVRSPIKPGDTLAKLTTQAPENPEPFDEIWNDFKEIVMPGMTHWQHPRFFAYFSANNTPASALAEALSSIVAPNCMLWQTSPSATEMETRMMEWLQSAVGLPKPFKGVIQDSASSATLATVLTMREIGLDWHGNSQGLSKKPTLRIYCSDQVHSSVDKAIWIAGIGQENLIKIPTSGPLRSMRPEMLSSTIKTDRAQGYLPIGIIAATGATSMGACDNLHAIADIAEQENLLTHLDAAWAGSAMICPEFRTIWDGSDRFDSIVLNPHKWMGAQFDCSAHFLRHPDKLRKTLAIRPEYLKTNSDTEVIDYSEWSIPLGRRFRALKLWFLMRCYGLESIRTRIRNHVSWSQALCERLRVEPEFQIVTEPILSLWTFKLKNTTDDDTRSFVDKINNDGRIYVTPTVVDDTLVIRFSAGTFDCCEDDFQTGFDTILELAKQFLSSSRKMDHVA